MTRRSISTRERIRIFEAAIRPLSQDEKGRGVVLPIERTNEIICECLRLVRSGATQKDIQRLLGATRSRVSRWCADAVQLAGDRTLHHRIKSRTKTPIQRIWARIDVRGKNECWPWLGSVRSNGYGSPPVRGESNESTVHREVYRILICDIPDGMVIDHICGNRSCCNPSHLQLAHQNENIYFRRLRHAS